MFASIAARNRFPWSLAGHTSKSHRYLLGELRFRLRGAYDALINCNQDAHSHRPLRSRRRLPHPCNTRCNTYCHVPPCTHIHRVRTCRYQPYHPPCFLFLFRVNYIRLYTRHRNTYGCRGTVGGVAGIRGNRCVATMRQVFVSQRIRTPGLSVSNDSSTATASALKIPSPQRMPLAS